MSDPREMLGEVARQQTAMADRIRLPRWYVPVFAVTWTVLLASPGVMREHERLGIPQFPYTLTSCCVLLVLLVVFRRRSGLHTLWRSSHYPALKRQLARTVAVMVGGFSVVTCLHLLNGLWSGLVWLTILAAVSSGGLAAAQLRRVNHEIRRDVIEGRVDA
jgi:hypothetical protein